MAKKSGRSRGKDVGIIGPKAEKNANLRIRGELMKTMRTLMDERQLTQAQWARIFGTRRPRVSDIGRGRTDLIGIDALVKMLGHAGIRTSLVVKLPPASSRRR